MKLFKSQSFGSVTIKNDAGTVVVTFAASRDGSLAYGWFVGGLARIHPESHNAGTTLFDTDTDQYVVGNLADLVA